MDFVSARNILGLSENYTDDDLKEQYKLLAKKFHPDNQKYADKNKFIEVKEAYEFLLNKERINKNQNKKNDSIKKDKKVCPMCGGSGIRREKIKTPHGYMAKKVTCKYCNGDGFR